MDATERSALAAELDAVCRLVGHFVLRSGATSDVYFDKYQFEGDPLLLGRLVDAMLPLVPPTTEVLGGLELGGVPLATVLSARTGLPLALVRKKRKQYGTRRLAEGPEVHGKRVTLIEDVITSGGQVTASAADLRAAGAVVSDVLCVIDREAGGRKVLAEAGIRMHFLFTRSELDASRTQSKPAEGAARSSSES